MKLYIWACPYQVSYGSSMLIAVADTEEQARAIAEGAPKYSYGKFRNNEETGGSIKLGAPHARCRFAVR